MVAGVRIPDVSFFLSVGTLEFQEFPLFVSKSILITLSLTCRFAMWCTDEEGMWQEQLEGLMTGAFGKWKISMEMQLLNCYNAFE